jgi:aspartate-semialdehyde dehydrogenase
VISAQVNRVPVIDGHTMTVSVELASAPDGRGRRRRHAHVPRPAAGADAADGSDPAIVVMDAENRPQPRLDADLGGGMTVSVGRVRTCPVLTHKFVALGHNTIRGAARRVAS